MPAKQTAAKQEVRRCGFLSDRTVGMADSVSGNWNRAISRSDTGIIRPPSVGRRQSSR